MQSVSLQIDMIFIYLFIYSPSFVFLVIVLIYSPFIYLSFQILTTLRRNLDIPITCKIRLLNSSQDTVELARRIETTGVSALAVHGR